RLQAGAGKAAGEDFVVVLRRGFMPVQRGNDGAVRERELAGPKRLDRNIVAQLGAHLFQAASGQVVDGDQAPVAVAGRNRDAVDRGGVALGLRRTLLGTLCRRRRDVKSADRDDGANPQGPKNRRSSPQYHDLLPVGATDPQLWSRRISVSRGSVS